MGKVHVGGFLCIVNPVLQADSCFAKVIGQKVEFSGVESAYIVAVTMDNINAVPNYYNAIHKEIIDSKQAAETYEKIN